MADGRDCLGPGGPQYGVWDMFWASRPVLSMSFHLGSRRDSTVRGSAETQGQCGHARIGVEVLTVEKGEIMITRPWGQCLAVSQVPRRAKPFRGNGDWAMLGFKSRFTNFHCVTLGKLLSLSAFQFFHLSNGDATPFYR